MMVRYAIYDGCDTRKYEKAEKSLRRNNFSALLLLNFHSHSFFIFFCLVYMVHIF